MWISGAADAKDAASARGTPTVVDSCLEIELTRDSGRGKTNGDAESGETVVESETPESCVWVWVMVIFGLRPG